jgi:hypothetical protein
MFPELIAKSAEIDESTVLWKYLDLSKFISLLSKKSLWLARVDTFKDKHEGMFPLEMKRALDKIYKDFEKEENTKDGPIQNTTDFQQHLIKNAYINCWHQNLDENMVMWEIYGKTENSVAIQTTVKDLTESVSKKDLKKYKYKVAFEPVIYEKLEDIPGQLTYESPFFIKRPHFKFEKEVRLFLSTYSTMNPTVDTPIGIGMSVNLNTIINDIYVHPDASSWFFDVVQALVDKFELSIPVKKGLYGNTS